MHFNQTNIAALQLEKCSASSCPKKRTSGLLMCNKIQRKREKLSGREMIRSKIREDTQMLGEVKLERSAGPPSAR